MNSRPDLVIFDCDGVLVDSEVISNRIFVESFAELGIVFTLEEMLAFGVGKNAVTLAAAIEQEFGVTLPVGFIEGQRARIMEAFTTELRPIDGIPELLAALKLRQRNLGPLLEGTGWAVNGRVKINMPLGVALTERGVLPPNSDRLAFDPYEDESAKTRRLVGLALAILVLAWLALAKIFHQWPF